MSGINRTASLIETPCSFRQPWASRRKSNMIATRRIFSVLVLLLVSTSWSLFAEPKTNRKADDKSSSGVSNDSYRGLSGLSSGVTTWNDAGSAGALTLPGLREFVVDRARVRITAFLNISNIGLVGENHECA